MTEISPSIHPKGGKRVTSASHPHGERLTDGAFMKGFVRSVLSILLCMAALSWMTYAWFSFSPAHADFPGSFDLEVTVTPAGSGAPTDKPITVTAVAGQEGLYTCILPTAGVYTVTLVPTEGSAAKGYCAVTLGGRRLYTEAVIGDHTERGDVLPVNAPFTFTVKTTEERTTVQFRTRFGIPAAPYIHAGDSLTVDKP
jgi:hypothetical protein